MGTPAPPEPPSSTGPSLVAIYALLLFALFSLFGAALGIYGGLSKLANASSEVEQGYQRIAAAEDILSLARDMETGQRGFLLSGQDRFLAPYKDARAQAPAAWQNLARLTPHAQIGEVNRICATYMALEDINARTIAERRAKGERSGSLAQDISAGKARMDELRSQVNHYVERERVHLRLLRREDDLAYRDAIVQALIGSLALILTGALLYAAIREARRAAGQNAALAEAAEQRFQATFEQASIGILHFDPKGKPILVNDALCRLTGYSREDILSAEPGSPAYGAAILQEPDVQNAVAQGASTQIYDARYIVRKDGSPLWVASILSAVRSSDGEIAFWSLFVRDLSEQRRAEQDLIESQDRLRRLQDEMAHIGRVNDLGEMAAAIAHEVNQPLTAISNYMSAAQHVVKNQPEANEDLVMLMGRASEQAVRAGQIIRRMRSFIERREEVRSREDLGELIESAIDLALLGLDKSRFDIRHQKGAEDIELWVDPVQIQQILLILLRNSMEAIARDTPKKRAEITIATDLSGAEPGCVAIHVTDNGPGLDPNILVQLFQPFATTKPGNLGMGLPIARRLAEQHGGRLETIPSKTGAHFLITLPLQAGREAQADS